MRKPKDAHEETLRNIQTKKALKEAQEEKIEHKRRT